MQYKQFGKNGPMVSRLGFGCMRLPSVGQGADKRCDDETCIPILRRAFELGINFFDTAWGYTNRDNQRIVGKALHDVRDQVYLSSKLPPDEVQQPGDFRRKLEHTLRLMDTDYLDFYHMHALNAKKWAHAQQVEMHRDMLKAKEEGLIRHISFSFHDAPRVMVDIADSGIFDTLLCQYNLIDQSNEEVMQTLADRGMGVMVMGPIAGGMITSGGQDFLKLYDTPAQTPQELALRFVLGYDAVSLALSGMESIAMVEQNVAIAEQAMSVTPEERARYKAKNDQLLRLSDLYCSGCAYCNVCPKGIRPQQHFKAYNRARVWGLYDAARKDYLADELDKNVEKCVSCGLCAAQCPQFISIPQKLREIRTYFAPEEKKAD